MHDVPLIAEKIWRNYDLVVVVDAPAVLMDRLTAARHEQGTGRRQDGRAGDQGGQAAIADFVIDNSAR